jgi:hypothetical protein
MTRRIAVIVLACLGQASLGLGVQAAPVPHVGLLPRLFASPRPPPSLMFTYHGWRIDASRAAKAQGAAKTVKLIEAQLDIVEHVGLQPKALDLLRTIPILGDMDRGPEPGRYVRGRGVFVRVKGLDPKRPVVLRQLLYAYQDRALPGGYANPDVARFRREAADKHVWPLTATMLADDADYFAMTATVYLYGAITREPYTRADLAKTQPDAYQWLANLFDGGRARR